jgi:hypothetical protein
MKKGRKKLLTVECGMSEKREGKGKQELRVHREQASYESCMVSLKSIILGGWVNVRAVLRTALPTVKR